MASLRDRLKERKLFQWAVAYAAGAWAILEVLGYVGDQFEWPLLVGQILTVLAAFGFFITLVLAWYHGEKGRQTASGPELLLVAALLVMAGAVLSLLRPAEQRAGPSETPSARTRDTFDDRPSVAALPFADLSSNPDDAYLADGIHEEVLTQLSKIGGLKVVSRTSVMGYREPQQSLRRIAEDLGVGAILEGSVERVLDRVRVTAQLIDAQTDEHLWAGSFDREITLEDLLDMQAEVARQIAKALRAELTTEEEALIGAKPTKELEAYQAYLRGRYFSHLPHYSQEDVARASQEFHRAVELDSTFALAWMELANAHARQVYYWTDASEARREMARAAAERAMELDSPSPEVRLAQGLNYLWLDRDPERALNEIARAEEGLPNNQAVYEARGAVFELLGRYEDAISEYRTALDLSPGDASVLTKMSLNYWVLRQYRTAEAYGQEAINRAPDQLWPSLTKVLAIWGDRGPTEETERLLESLPHNLGWVRWARTWQGTLGHRYEEVLDVLSEPGFEWVRLKLFARPRCLYEAFTYRALGRTEEARRLFEEAKGLLELEVERHPDDPRYHSSLGLAQAALGLGEQAVREGETAVALLPTSVDAFYGLPYLWDLAAINALVGNADDALDGIEYLLSVPSWVSPPWLKGDVRLDALRGEPRFQALLKASP